MKTRIIHNKDYPVKTRVIQSKQGLFSQNKDHSVKTSKIQSKQVKFSQNK